MKNRKLLLIVSLVLALTMSLGGTLAYLTDTDADINVMTLGKVEIVQNEQKRTDDGLDEFVSGLPALPAVTTSDADWAPNTPVEMDNGMWVNMWSDNVKNDIDKIVTVTNTGKSPAYVRTIVAVESVRDNDWHLSDMMAGYYATEADAKSKTNKVQTMVGNAWEDIGVVNIDGTNFYVLVATYKDPLAAGKTSAPSMTGVAMDDDVNSAQLADYGDEWEIRVLSQAVQADGFTDTNNNGTAADEALIAGFGAVTEGNVKSWLAKATLEADIASPSDKYPTNNPPATVVKSAEELEDALAKGGKITLANNLTMDEGASLIVPQGISVELNLNGNILTNPVKATAALVNNGTLTITGGTIKNENIEAQGAAAIHNYGTLTLNNVNVGSDLNRGAAVQNKGGIIDINGGFFATMTRAHSSNGYAYVFINNSGTMNIKDAEVEGLPNGIFYAEAGIINVDGGSYKILDGGNTWYVAYAADGATINLNSGTYKWYRLYCDAPTTGNVIVDKSCVKIGWPEN